MKHPIVAALANFFLPGAGYLIAGVKRTLGLAWLLAAVGLTVVEFGIRSSEPTLWLLMFVSVFVMNTAFAIDVYREAGESTDRRIAVRSAAVA